MSSSLINKQKPVEQLDWVFNESNKDQDYVTHTLFRYFGKLPPTVTRKIINYADIKPKESIIDIMSGSGTTAVESALMGYRTHNVDANPLSIMIGQVKTRKYNRDSLEDTLRRVLLAFDDWKSNLNGNGNNLFSSQSSYPTVEKIKEKLPSIQNLDYWFSDSTKQDLALMLLAIEEFSADSEKDFLKVCFASIVRKASNASSSTGRIFIDREKIIRPVRQLFLKQAMTALDKVMQYAQHAKEFEHNFVLGDARSAPLPDSLSKLSIFHPPYFALYRYSSDILRFELEWLGMDRTDIRNREMEDGFKTTRRELFDVYINDIGSVFRELHRVTKSDGLICYINNNSTLRDERLPVIEESIHQAELAGLKLVAICDRDVIHTQAVYHRSARKDKVTKQDYLVFFRKL